MNFEAKSWRDMLLAGLLASSIAFGGQENAQGGRHVAGQNQENVPAVGETPEDKRAPLILKPVSRESKNIGKWNPRLNEYYKRNWGVEVIGVRPISSGYMLQFRYRVVDKNKAYVLNNKKAKPYLIDEATGNVLGVPTMEKVGELRQTPAFKDNQAYFIIFGNPGALVKSGGTVSIVVDSFRINGLVVE